MKKIRQVFSYHIEIVHEGDFWIAKEAVRHLNDAKRTTEVVDLKNEVSLRTLLDLDVNNRVAPEDMSGLSVKEFLNNDFWAAYSVLDVTTGKEVVEVSVEWTENKTKVYRDVNLDTKWSLWSSDEIYFQEIDSNALESMKSAFDGTGEPICLHLATTKEIRFGTVWVEQHEMTYEFRSEWDESCALIPDDVNLNDDQRAKIENQIREWCSTLKEGYAFRDYVESNVGAFVSGMITTNSFSDALLQVDKAEDVLLAMDKENNEALDRYIAELT